MTDEEIDKIAEEIFGFNSATEHYKGWVEGFKYAQSYPKNESVIPPVVGRSEQLSCPRCRHTGIDTDKDGLNYCRSCSHYWRAT